MSCKCDFGTGLNTCHCGGCCRTFTSVHAFDIHQALGDDGNAICRDPATLMAGNGKPRLVIVRKTPGGQPVWGKFGPMSGAGPERWAWAQGTSQQKSGGQTG